MLALCCSYATSFFHNASSSACVLSRRGPFTAVLRTAITFLSRESVSHRIGNRDNVPVFTARPAAHEKVFQCHHFSEERKCFTLNPKSRKCSSALAHTFESRSNEAQEVEQRPCFVQTPICLFNPCVDAWPAFRRDRPPEVAVPEPLSPSERSCLTRRPTSSSNAMVAVPTEAVGRASTRAAPGASRAAPAASIPFPHAPGPGASPTLSSL